MNCGIHGSRSGPVAWDTRAGYLEIRMGTTGWDGKTEAMDGLKFSIRIDRSESAKERGSLKQLCHTELVGNANGLGLGPRISRVRPSVTFI